MASVKWSAKGDIVSVITDKLMVLDDPGGTPANGTDTIADILDLQNAATKTLTNKTIATADNTITVVEADISDLGSYITASSTDTLTNKTIDQDGTGNNITNIADASIKAAAAIALSKLAAITFTERIPLVMEVPEGTVGYPDINALTTQTSKISGMVMPDGASVSEINFKCVVPQNLASTPAASIKFYIMTLGAVAGPADLRLTVSTSANADTENADDAFAVETEQTVTMPTATQTLDIYDQDMTTDPTAGDLLTVQLARDPTDAADDFTDDVMIVAAFLEIDRTVT